MLNIQKLLLKFITSTFWSLVISKRKTFGYPKSMVYKDKSYKSDSLFCSIFAEFFSNVYCPTTTAESTSFASFSKSNQTIFIGSLQLSFGDVLRKLFHLNVNEGSGPDAISPLLLTNCALSLANPLHKLFNLSLSTGTFPDRWKTAYITPIFKSGVENYRGIAILPTLGKVFESLVTDVLTPSFTFHYIYFTALSHKERLIINEFGGVYQLFDNICRSWGPG